MKGFDLQEIIDAIEDSKSTLNELVSAHEKNLTCEETLRASRELDELINMYNSIALEGTLAYQNEGNSFFNESLFEE